MTVSARTAQPTASTPQRVLLIVSGGIAAYKALELVRLLRRDGLGVAAVLTAGGAQFVTPLSLQALTEEKVHSALWSLTDESEMGHIQLSRSADLVVVAPASANMLAKMASGLADDLASTLLLATDTPVLVAPAMNVRMWTHPATAANLALLRSRGVQVVGPDEGAMACGEFGPGRLAEPPVILDAIRALLRAAPDAAAELARTPGHASVPGSAAAPPPVGAARADLPAGGASAQAEALRLDAAPSAPGLPTPRGAPSGLSAAAPSMPDLPGAGGPGGRDHGAASLAPGAQPLAGRHVLVTSGPTHEPIDPVRYIANRSSGRQGHAIAAALAGLGARVTLVSGPVAVPDPEGVQVRRVETAAEMLAACTAALPADVAVCAAAVADWRVAEAAAGKIKKGPGAPPSLTLVPNPDILAALSAAGPRRPRLVVGFAAETDDVLAHATAKRARKGCDWIVANDVSPATGIMGGDANEVHLVTARGAEHWPLLPKAEVAARLAARIADALA